jgi:hypothetical protein
MQTRVFAIIFSQGIPTLPLLNHRQHLMRKTRNFYCRQKIRSS